MPKVSDFIMYKQALYPIKSGNTTSVHESMSSYLRGNSAFSKSCTFKEIDSWSTGKCPEMISSRCKIKLMAGQFHMLIEIRSLVLSSWEGTDVYLDPIGIGGYS